MIYKARSVVSILAALTLLFGLAGCDQLVAPQAVAPLATELLPTAIAQTLQARGSQMPATATVAPASPEPGSAETKPASPTALASHTAPPSETPLPSPTPVEVTDTPTEAPTLLPTQPVLTLPAVLADTPTPFPQAQQARVQIFRLGELSKVVSPLVATARLTSRWGKVVRFDLHGEDGRLLARQLRVYNDLPWHVATLTMSLDFEISVAAELGRLVVSVEDAFGRMMDVNSVNVLLMSSGTTEYNPPGALYEAIVIQDPQPKALIVGGVAYVSGIAKPFEEQPLKVVLIAEDGRVLGQRLAGVQIPIPGGYGVFFADVAYSVTEMTPALLVVFESGGLLSEYAHLTSIEVVLAP
jgi:hypothetical protein